MTPLLWFALLIVAIALIHLSVSLIMRRLDITPAVPDERSRGFRDVLDRFRAAAERRRSREDPGNDA